MPNERKLKPKLKLAITLTKNFLYQKYILEQNSTVQIALAIGCSPTTITKYLNKFKIKTRSISEAKQGKQLSDKHKKNISRALKGKMIGKNNPFFNKQHSKETKKKISEANKGRKWNHSNKAKLKIGKTHKGKRLSEKTKEKIAKARRGTILSEETKKKISKANRGKSNPMFGKKHSKETLKKMLGTNNPMYGKSHSQESKKKMSISSSGPLNPMYGKRGKETPGWKKPENRITPLYKQIRYSADYSIWRNKVFKRDNWTCQACNDFSRKNHSIILHADHIKPFAQIIFEYDIKTLEQSKTCKELWDLNNGRTLCLDCHKKTKTWTNGTKQLLKIIKPKK